VDIIDASVMSKSFFSFDHSYYAGDRQVLEDMAYLIKEGLSPAKRLLDPKPTNQAPQFWSFRP
jgi:hypothetical protein